MAGVVKSRLGTRCGPRYSQEISLLHDWFAERVGRLGTLTVTVADYKAGDLSEAQAHSDLCVSAYVVWRNGRSYELSHDQICIALFSALRAADLLVVR